MTIETINTDKLNPAKYNPRVDLKPGDEEYEKLKQSMETFGCVEPIVWNRRTGNVIGGHQRLKVLKANGVKAVECSVVDLSDKDENLLNLALNKISGAWDEEKLSELLLELEKLDCEISLSGFDDKEISNLVDRFAAKDLSEDGFDVDAAMEASEEPISQKGDIWILGRHRLICGDVTDPIILARLLEEETADLIVTDPPYNVDYTGGVKGDREKIENDCMNEAKFKAFLREAFGNLAEHLKRGGAFYIWYADKERMSVESALRDVELIPRQNLVWIKNHFVLGRQDYQWQHEPCLYGMYGWKDGAAHYFTDDRTQSTVIEIDRPIISKEHPTMKPIELFGKLIANSSRRDEIVLDGFAGSGTTIIACEQLRRQARCVELSEKYCDVIVRRYAEYTGNEPLLLRDGEEPKAIKLN